MKYRLPAKMIIPAVSWVSRNTNQIKTVKDSWTRTSASSRRYLSSSTPSTSSASSLSSILAPRLDGLDKPTVWHEFSPLASQYNSVNLGQGFPDWDPPNFAIESMKMAIDPKYNRHANQYARSAAHLPLANILAEEYTLKLGRDDAINPETEVATAVGCSNALYCALQGLVGPGDEVIMLEPAFDIYMAQVKISGATSKFVPLRSKPVASKSEDTTTKTKTANEMFTLDMNELENAITERTKVFILNTPHNPTGKMFTKEELYQISNILQKYPQVVVISDEVYEHIVFDPENSPHIPIASIPGMYDKTLTLSSSGKTFSATGWKIGWAVGPPHLVRAVTAVQQCVNFCAPTPNQDAIALCLQKAKEPYQDYESYYKFLAAEYLRKRNLLIDTLHYAGITPIIPPGGFFIMGDTSRIDFPTSYLEEVTEAMPTTPMPRDWAMSRWMTKEVGVTAIPPSAFYSSDHYLAKDLLRFAFCKTDDTILEAQSRFKTFFQA